MLHRQSWELNVRRQRLGKAKDCSFIHHSFYSFKLSKVICLQIWKLLCLPKNITWKKQGMQCCQKIVIPAEHYVTSKLSVSQTTPNLASITRNTASTDYHLELCTNSLLVTTSSESSTLWRMYCQGQ
jgi:hypothetical protein